MVRYDKSELVGEGLGGIANGDVHIRQTDSHCSWLGLQHSVGIGGREL